MAPGFVADAVIQVHPTLACNLRCGHCYSSSGPGAGRGGLPVDTLLAALQVLRGEEYRILSVSGGEPFAYRALGDLVHGAAELGYRVNLITNGTLLTHARLAALASSLAFVAVSLDGSEAHHNRIRGSSTAFSRALDGMAVLARSNVRFGAVMTVGKATLADVPDVYEHCRAQGAALLSLRPLAPLGRGATLEQEALGTADLARLFLATQILNGLDERMHVRTDVVPTAWIADGGEPTPRVGDDAEGPLSARVNPLVIDENGSLIPLAYGMHPRFALGSIDDVLPSLERARTLGLQGLPRLVQSAFHGLSPTSEPYVDWFAGLVLRSNAGRHADQRSEAVAAAAWQPVTWPGSPPVANHSG